MPNSDVEELLSAFGLSNSIDLDSAHFDADLVERAVAVGLVAVDEWDIGISRGNFLVLTRKGRLVTGHRNIWDRFLWTFSWLSDLLPTRPAH